MDSDSQGEKPFVTAEQGFMLGGVAVGLVLLNLFAPKMETVESMFAGGIVAALFGGIGKVIGKLFQKKRQK